MMRNMAGMMKKVQEMQSRMQDLTGGLGLPPGFKLPF